MSERSVRVNVDQRTFIVDFDDDGNALRIKERKTYATGTLYEGLCNVSYWNKKHHRLGKSTTLPVRIIEEARRREKLA